MTELVPTHAFVTVEQYEAKCHELEWSDMVIGELLELLDYNEDAAEAMCPESDPGHFDEGGCPSCG